MWVAVGYLNQDCSQLNSILGSVSRGFDTHASNREEEKKMEGSM